MPSEKVAAIGGIIAGMFFGSVLTFTSYNLESQPPKVALVVDGMPHYGALRSYDWGSAGGGGGSHWYGNVPEVITIQNGSNVSVRPSWDRRLIELSCVQLENTCIIYNEKTSTFLVSANDGDHTIFVTALLKGNLSERVRYEYHIKVI